MTDRDETTRGDTATETHHEPHGSAMPHGAADDVPAHGQVDEHATGEHGGAPLGPVDTRAWLAAFLGVALGLVVAACFLAATAAAGA